MYTTSFDPDTRTLTLRLQAFWTPATRIRFVADVGAQAIALLVRHGRFAVFVDCSGYQIQTSEVVQGFAPLIARAARRDVPVALRVKTMLGKLQAEHALRDTGVGIFLDEADARTWLAERHPARLAA